MTTRKALLKAHAVRWNAVRKELQKNCRLAALPVEFAQASSNLPVQRQSRSFHRTTTETRAEPKSKLKTLYVGSVPVLVLKSLGAKMDWGRSARNAAQEGARRTERRQRDAAQKRSPSRCCVFQGHVQCGEPIETHAFGERWPEKQRVGRAVLDSVCDVGLQLRPVFSSKL